jgi:hypothetical protein
MANDTNGTNGTNERRPRWINTPVFGRCKLVPHSMAEEPTSVLGYVERSHAGGTLKLALYQRGEWRTTGLKSLGGTITAWYSVEGEDGRPII